MGRHDQRERGVLASVNRGITCCGCSFAALCGLAFLWAVLGSILPGEVFWFPICLASVVWSGKDGNGGISGLWG